MTEATNQKQQTRWHFPLWVVLAILGLAVVVVIWSSGSGGSPSDEIAPTVATKAGLQGDIEAALGDGNRGVERVSDFRNSSGTAGQVYVKFAINDNLSDNLRAGGAQLDCTNILKAIAQSGATYGSVRIVGTFPTKDVYGNVKETEVVRLDFDAGTVKKINWDGFLYKDIYTIANSAEVHAQFSP
jgi:hypothetical protein